MANVNARCVDCFENQEAYGESSDADVVYNGTSVCWDHYVTRRDRYDVEQRRLNDKLDKMTTELREGLGLET